jgi:putative transposase
MVSPSSRRRAVKSCVEEGLSSAAQACRAIALARSSYYRPCSVSLRRRRVRREVLKLSEKHPRYGYRRITALLRRAGLIINPKRVQRLRRMEGVQVCKKQRRMRRVGLSAVERLRATKARQVWSS